MVACTSADALDACGCGDAATLQAQGGAKSVVSVNAGGQLPKPSMQEPAASTAAQQCCEAATGRDGLQGGGRVPPVSSACCSPCAPSCSRSALRPSMACDGLCGCAAWDRGKGEPQSGSSLSRPLALSLLPLLARTCTAGPCAPMSCWHAWGALAGRAAACASTATQAHAHGGHSAAALVAAAAAGAAGNGASSPPCTALALPGAVVAMGVAAAAAGASVEASRLACACACASGAAQAAGPSAHTPGRAALATPMHCMELPGSMAERGEAST